jgi:membrane associated rhomboid family serine protease
MYGGFWYQLKNAFRQSNSSLYKIIAINLLVFVVVLILNVFLKLSGAGDFYALMMKYLMIPADLPVFVSRPWTLFTYMFLHEKIFHILFNMLFLYWFGLLIMEYLGSQRLANLYVLGGLSGGLLYLMMYNLSPYFQGAVSSSYMLGASAGVYAIVIGAARLVPNTTFHLLLLGPVKIKYIAIFYVVLAFANSVGQNAGGELAHLGGAALGYVYVVLLQKGTDIGKPIDSAWYFFTGLFKKRSRVKVSYRKKTATTASTTSTYSTGSSSKSGANPTASDTTQEEIDKILDKIAERGYEALNKEEKRKLFEFSKK